MKVRSVLMVAQTFYPVLGGAEKQALELSKALVGRGLRVSVITRRLPGLPAAENIAGVEIERFPVTGSGLADSFSFMLRVFVHMAARRADYDAVHVHLASSPALAALLAGRLFGKRVVVKLGRGKGLDEISLSKRTLPGRLKLFLFSFLRPEVLVLSREARDWLASGEGCPGVKPRLFRNGVDTGRYTPPLYTEKLAAKAAVGLENDQVFLFVGRLVPEKRLAELIEAWAETLSGEMHRPRARLVIVGKGPEEARLRDAAGQLGVAGSVTLAGSKDDLLPWYRAADVFVLPSVNEGMSNSMLEAMACGLPVLASRVDAARDVVAEGESGLLFDPFSRAELKAGLKQFLDDRGLALRLGEKARAAVVAEYSMARAAEEAVKIYEGEA